MLDYIILLYIYSPHLNMDNVDFHGTTYSSSVLKAI